MGILPGAVLPAVDSKPPLLWIELHPSQDAEVLTPRAGVGNLFWR